MHDEIRGGPNLNLKPIFDLYLIVRTRTDIEDAVLCEQSFHSLLDEIAALFRRGIKHLPERATVVALVQEYAVRDSVCSELLNGVPPAYRVGLLLLDF